MKNVLKIWLVDNTVTVDNKDDKIGQLESSGNLSLQDILDEMNKEDTGLRPETIEHDVKLYNRVVGDLILSGYSVNTGLYHAVAQLRGVIDGGKWNPEKNSVYVSFTQDKELREAIAQTSVSILGERQSVMYVAGFSPATAIAGRPFTVNGRMLKIAGTDSSVGIRQSEKIAERVFHLPLRGLQPAGSRIGRQRKRKIHGVGLELFHPDRRGAEHVALMDRRVAAFAVEAHGNQPRDAALLHRDPVYRPGGGHRALVVRNHEELRVARELFEHVGVPAYVRVVERRVELVEHAERAGLYHVDCEQQRHRRHRALASG